MCVCVCIQAPDRPSFPAVVFCSLSFFFSFFKSALKRLLEYTKRKRSRNSSASCVVLAALFVCFVLFCFVLHFVFVLVILELIYPLFFFVVCLFIFGGVDNRDATANLYNGLFFFPLSFQADFVKNLFFFFVIC